METKIRYEVRYEDSKDRKWHRGKESGLYEYNDAIRFANTLSKNDEYKNINIIKVTELYEIIDYKKEDLI